MRTTCLAIFVTLHLLALPSSAAEFRPVVVCSIASYDETLADLDYLGSTAQNPNFTKAIGKALVKSTGVQGLDGLDTRRPGGAVLLTDGLRILPVAFVPVNDAAALLKAMAPVIGEAQPQPDRPRLWKIGQGPTTGYVLEQDGWAYVVQSTDVLSALPDPLRTLGALPSTYDVAIAFYPTRLPEPLRTLGVDMLREQMQVEPPRRDQESDSAYALRKTLTGQSYLFAERLFTEYQQLTLGWSLDRKTKAARLEVLVTAEPGSQLERSLTGWKAAAGVKRAPDAALSAHAALVLEPPQAAQFRAFVDGWQSSVSSEPAASIVAALARLWQPAIEKGIVDISLGLHGQAPPLAAVAAVRIGDTAAVRTVLEQLAARNGQGASPVRVQLDAARLGELRVHSIELARLGEDELFQKLLGPDATLFIAESGDTVLVAIGNNALTAIHKSLTPATGPQPPLGLSLKLGTAATVAASQMEQRNAALVSLLGANLRAGDDRLLVSVENEDRSLRVRLEVREGVLRGASLGLSLWAIQALSAK